MTAPTFLGRRTAERPVSETLRAVADRLNQLPPHLPDPAVTVYQGADPTVAWHRADAETARAILAALPGEWRAHDTYMIYLTRDDDCVSSWAVHLATAETEQKVVRRGPVADPAALIAEASGVTA